MRPLTVEQIIDRLPAPSVPRQPTSDECFEEFVAEAQERTSAGMDELTREGLAVRRMAQIMRDCARQLETIHATLGEARSVTRREGLGDVTRSATFKASEVDEYATVEAWFWDKLSPAAEALLKAELREELAR